MKRTPDNTKSKLKILATITSQLAALCEELAAENDGNEDPIVDKTNVKAETGEEPRPFQEAARRGDFPNWKTAHGRAAKKSDVMAWLERRAQRKARPVENYDAAFEQAARRIGGAR